jgi:surface protein
MKRLVVFLVLLASVLSIKAAEMYVVISTDGSTVTFYYDDEKYSKEGIVCGIEDGTWCEKLKESIQLPREIYEDDPNMIHAYNITSAVFDSSFKNARPTSTSCWFLGFESLCSIENIEYLNTSEVKDMSSMFSSCQNLKSINLSSFDTRKVTNMSCMFDGCRSL